MRATLNCMNCGTQKPQGEYLSDYCSACFSAIAGAEAAATAAGEDKAAARRAALAARAHQAHRNFPDPRAFDRRTIWLDGNKPVGA